MEIIYNKNSFDNAVEVDNYPWGYKFKTKRRYWIETTKRGDRVCYQTLNPKTDKWCAVKKSTYSAVKVLYFDENNHVKSYGISLGWSDAKKVHKFEKTVDTEKLSEEQRMKICEAKAINHVNSKVEVVFSNVTMMSDEEREARDLEQKEVKDKLNRYANHVYNQCLIKNNLGGE
tara:strand:- start:178 stop:699 length:522 start_codon:yes stop_codon:yes gene_type:complete